MAECLGGVWRCAGAGDNGFFVRTSSYSVAFCARLVPPISDWHSYTQGAVGPLSAGKTLYLY